MKDFIDFLKLPPNIFRSFIYCQWYIIIIASKVSPKVLYYKFREKYGFTIGIVFVISTALLIVLLLSKIFHFFYDKYASKRFRNCSD